MSHEPGTYVVRTLGCKANLYDSQLIEAELQRRGWHSLAREGAQAPGGGGDGLSGARLCVINSCTVTDEADRQSRALASRLARENPAARVVVTGCAAQVDPERLARSRGIHYVVGNQDKHRLVDLVLRCLEDEAPASGQVLGSARSLPREGSRHPAEQEWPEAAEAAGLPAAGGSGDTGKTRAFLKIQEGCNSFCTYCIIPYGRGPSRSLGPDEVLARAGELVAQGARELVVTGTNIGDYGVDWGLAPETALAGLFGRLLAETGLERLRVGSLDPTEITPALLALMEREPRFCPHFHVSLQSASPRILRLMKRKYSLEQARECLERIAGLASAPFVGMDLITGFPGETADEFEAAFRELERLPWTRLHVFPYSEREGTPATRLPGAVAASERAARARRLGELSLARMSARMEGELRRGAPLQKVLLEKPSRRPPSGVDARSELWISGYTPNYLRVHAPVSASEASQLRNREATVALEAVLSDRQQGEAALLGRIESSE